MKNSIFLVLSVFVTINASSQSIPTPEFNNEIQAISPTNSLVKLEKLTINYHFTSPPFGAKKTYLQVPGCCSPIICSGKISEGFVIKVELGTDPQALFTLVRFEPNDNNRRILINKVTLKTAMAGTNVQEMPKVALNIKKISEGIYVMYPQEPLAAGQYGFIKNRQGFDTDFFSYCFSVKSLEN